MVKNHDFVNITYKTNNRDAFKGFTYKTVANMNTQLTMNIHIFKWTS